MRPTWRLLELKLICAAANEQATGRTIPGGLELVEDLNDEDRARNKSVQSLVSLLADVTNLWPIALFKVMS
jgi:hypothetical protein